MNALLIYLAMGAAAPQASDPVVACREAYAADPPAHIACLERALSERTAMHDDARHAEAAKLGATDIGAHPRDDTEQRPRQIDVVIVGTSYVNDRGTFRLADGQVWRETERTPERLRLEPDTRYRARIERGSLGGYRIYIDGVRRMIKVERIK